MGFEEMGLRAPMSAKISVESDKVWLNCAEVQWGGRARAEKKFVYTV
jgi:hypothetical protein